MMKKRIAALMLVLCALMPNRFIYAASETDATAESSSVPTESFDRQLGMYRQTMGVGMEFLSSVPNGASVSDAVYFDVPSDIIVSLYKDGSEVAFKNKTVIANSGYYIMRLNATDYTTGEAVINVFRFRVSAPPKRNGVSSDVIRPSVACSAAVSADGDLYEYLMPNFKAFYTDVPSYGAEVDSALFVLPQNLGYSLTRNGRVIPFLNGKVYSEAGSYALTVYANSYAATGAYSACYITTLRFTVLEPDASDTDEEETITYEDIMPQSDYEDTAISEPVSAIKEPISDYLIENYYENAEIYSESFSTGDAFYTNIPNDGIVGGKVYFDFPYNMSVSMTKDGQSAAFANKSYINEAGSYLLTVSCVYGEDVYTARFSFRIQNGVGQAAEVGSGNEQSSVSHPTDYNDEIANDENKTYGYDSALSAYYVTVGESKAYFSVPNGDFSRSSVSIDIPNEITGVLQKNGEDIEIADEVSEDGSYTLFLSAEDGSEAQYAFYICSGMCNYLDEYTAPDGFTIVSVDYSDYAGVYQTENSELASVYNEGLAQIEDSAQTATDSFALPLDGEYVFNLVNDDGSEFISRIVDIDRIAPVLTFDGLDENNKTDAESVIIHCDDAEAIVADGDGKVTEFKDGSAEYVGKGKVKFAATDSAGNVSEYEISMGKSGTWLTVVVAVIIVVLAVILLLFIIDKILKLFLASGKKTKKKTEVQTQQPIEDDWENTDVANIAGDVPEDLAENEDDWESV